MRIVKTVPSNDGITTKYLQETEDSQIIETGYYNIDEDIICISSQIGCSMGCIFCATTLPINGENNKSFVRNLSAKEIFTQVVNVLEDKESTNENILFSYMGMGEPFLNYENVVESIKLLTNKYPNSRATISTMGVDLDLIRVLAHEDINTKLKLHVSLHASNDDLRKGILPNCKPIKETLDNLLYFTQERGVLGKVNYILIKGLNDSESHAKELIDVLKPYPFVLKLSNLNKINELDPSNDEDFNRFENILNNGGIKTCRFISKGQDIEAGCGQLRRHLYNLD